MAWTLRDLRFFVTAAETGSFTAAAEALFVSQAAVSRTIDGFERQIGERLLRRIARGCELTALGQQVLPEAKRVLAEAERFSTFLASRHRILRLGYAWAALGAHTPRFQREWARRFPATDLELVKHHSPTAGLAEGFCDAAIVRVPVDDPRFASVVIALERRVVAFASDDPEWSRRQRFRMAEIAERTVVIDTPVGSTTGGLWDGMRAPRSLIETPGVDRWLDAISAGRGVGTTSEATAHHHARTGIMFRPITDGPRIPVRIVWWRDEPPAGLEDLIDALTRVSAG